MGSIKQDELIQNFLFKMSYYIIIFVCTSVQGIFLVTDSPQIVVVIMQLYGFIV